MRKEQIHFYAVCLSILLATVLFSLFFYQQRDRISLFQRLSVSIEDLTVRLAARPISNAVAIAAIDEASLKQFGQWPWSRILISELTHTLHDAGASVVAYDLVLAEADRLSPAQLKPFWSTLAEADLTVLDEIPDSDEVLAEALAAHPNTVLGAFLSLAEFPDGKRIDDPFYCRRWLNLAGMTDVDTERIPSDIIPATEAIFPLPIFRKANSAIGILTTNPDFDRVIRRTPLVFQLGKDKLYSALSVEAVRLHLHRTNLFYGLAPRTREIRSVRLRELPIRVDGGGNAAINYRSTAPDQYSVADIFSGSFPSNAFSGKIVFVGPTAQGLHDLVNTPIGENIPGVQIHAVVADNLLTGDLLSTPRFWPAVIILAGLIGAAVAFIPSVPIGALVTGLSVLLFFYWVVLLRHFGLYAASPFEPMLCHFLSYGAIALLRFRRSDRQRKAVRGMFSSMVSPRVLRHLESLEGGPTLQGSRREVTVLFTDIEKFTSISEKLAPQELAALLREYFTPMTDICLAHGAYINKFIGDAIMAVFNAPADLPEHPKQAVLAAVKMQRELARLRPDFEARYGITLRMRCGIHTGIAIAGNMGSQQRFEYTVLGDTVNLASRLEGENKNHGTWILISEQTRKRLGDFAEATLIPVGEVTVRNRTEPVMTYEVRADKQPTPPVGENTAQ